MTDQSLFSAQNHHRWRPSRIGAPTAFVLASLAIHTLAIILVGLHHSAKPKPESERPVRIVLTHHKGSLEANALATSTRPKKARPQPQNPAPRAAPPSTSDDNTSAAPNLPEIGPKAPSPEASPPLSDEVGAGETTASDRGDADLASDGGGSAEGADAPLAVTEGGSTGVQGYEILILDHIRGRQYYPRIARQRRLEGTVWVDMTLRADGTIVTLSLHQSSGHDLLDQTALDLLERCVPFPSFPKTLTAKALDYRIPISFKLNDI